MRIDFTKMHGLGNDFILFDLPAGAPVPAAEQWRALSDRHSGIGFDQALVLQPPRRPGTDVFYRVFNADGSEVEQCGNGARCVAALLVRRGLGSDAPLAMDSLGGLLHARVLADQRVSVDMGVPDFTPAALPFDAPAQQPRYRLEVNGEQLEIRGGLDRQSARGAASCRPSTALQWSASAARCRRTRAFRDRSTSASCRYWTGTMYGCACTNAASGRPGPAVPAPAPPSRSDDNSSCSRPRWKCMCPEVSWGYTGTDLDIRCG